MINWIKKVYYNCKKNIKEWYVRTNEKLEKLNTKLDKKMYKFDKYLKKKFKPISDFNKNTPLFLRVIMFIVIVIFLEISFKTIDKFSYEFREGDSQITVYEEFKIDKDANPVLNEFLKSNIKNIENVNIIMSKKTFNNESLFDVELYIKDIKIIRKNYADIIKKELPSSPIKEVEKEKEKNKNKEYKYYVVFEEVARWTFHNNINEILLENNIKLTWDNKTVKDPSNIAIKSELLKVISSNIIGFALIIFLLFMLEKQGLFGSKDKYEVKDFSDIDEEEANEALDSLIGMEEIKEEVLISFEMLKDRKAFEDRNLGKTFNYLFAGRGGLGKTKIAEALAMKLRIPFISGTGNVETGYVGGGASVIKELFTVGRKLARNHKSKMAIIFLDEGQNLLKKRGNDKDSKWADDSNNELLAQLDGVKTEHDVDIIFIIASNFDDKNNDLDEAMLRRFKKKLFFRMPNLEERCAILKSYINKIKDKYRSEDIDFNYIAEITNDVSPAGLESIIEEANIIAMREKALIDTHYLEMAFERNVIGRTDRKTTSNMEKTRSIIANHELGHFVCHFQECFKESLTDLNIDANKITDLNKDELVESKKYISNNINVLKISVESIAQVNALGYVLNKQDTDILKTRLDLENEIISLYGGLASEKHFTKNEGEGGFTTGSYNDIEKVTKILDTMINQLGMYSDSPINLNLIKGDSIKSENIDLMTKKGQELFTKSQRIIEEYDDLIIHMHKSLLDNYVLKVDVALDIIFDYYINKKIES